MSLCLHYFVVYWPKTLLFLYHIWLFANFIVPLQERNRKDMISQEEIFRQKAPHYLLCFIEHCPLHEHCLRWLVGQQADHTVVKVGCVNPLLAQVGTDKCPQYRENVSAPHAKGMVHFYDGMPRQLEISIKSRLIGRYARRQYYEYRNGVRLITPQMQQDIARICQEAGWTQPLRFDDYQDDYVW